MNKGSFGLPYGQIIKEQESALVDYNTSVTETVIRAFPVPGRVGEVGAETRFFAWGDLLHNNVSTDALVLRVRLGKGIDITGTLLGEVTFNFSNQVGATRYSWVTNFKLTGLGEGRFYQDGSLTSPRTDTGAMNVVAWEALADAATTGIPTVAVGGLQQVVLTATWNASSANNALRKFGTLMIFDPKSGGML